ncbi:MAG: hypothetical protein R6V85_14170 [Polyangia bacterium]
MSRRLEELLEAIRSDTDSGATSLAVCALETLEIAAGDLPCESREALSTIDDLAVRIDNLRPSMAAVGSAAFRVAIEARRAVLSGAPPRAALERAARDELELIRAADERIAALAVCELGEVGTAVTCSWSATALACLERLRPELVLIGEGHSLGDGRRAARRMVENGLEVELTTDGALPAAVERADAVLVGADQILADGSLVNRAGTFPLALAARRFEVPFYAVCQRLKLAGRKEASIEEHPADLAGESPPGARVSCPLFDVTPPDLLGAVLTETGRLTASRAGRAGAEIARRRAELRSNKNK